MNHSQKLESNADEIQSVLIENASKTKNEVKKILMDQLERTLAMLQNASVDQLTYHCYLLEQ